MIKEGFKRPEISAKLGIKIGSVKHIAESHGLVTHRKMTDEEKSRVKVMHKEGIPVAEIALIIGKSVSSINYYLDSSKKTSFRCDEIVRLHKLKIGNKSIALFLNTTESNVRMVLRRKGFAKPRITDNEIQKIIDMANNGMKTIDISEIIGKSLTTIQAYLKRYGLSRPVGKPNKTKGKQFKWDFPKKQVSI